MDKNDPRFTIEHQFQEYCTRVKLDKNRVSTIQWIETRRTFYGAFTQMLFLMRDEISELSEDDGVETYQKMLTEANNFWITENNRQN